MRHFEGKDEVTVAKNAVLSRMNGCPDENCFACLENKRVIEELVTLVRDDALMGVIKTALSEDPNS